MTPKTLIVGLGMGRSGTTSLAEMLRSTGEAAVSHELNPLRRKFVNNTAAGWNCPQDAETMVGIALSRPQAFVGDVGHFWLPHVPYLRHLGQVAGVRMVELAVQRRRADVVDSLFRRWEARGHQPFTHSTEGWDAATPLVTGGDMRQQIGYYYDYYYAVLAQLGVRVFPIEALNDAAGVRSILDHIGIQGDGKVGVRLNQRAS